MDTLDPQNSAQPSTPAARAIAAFGGAIKLAAAIKRDPSAVYRWTYPAGRKGTGGAIPLKIIPEILRAARERGITLTANDLVDLDLSDAADTPADRAA